MGQVDYSKSQLKFPRCLGYVVVWYLDTGVRIKIAQMSIVYFPGSQSIYCVRVR